MSHPHDRNGARVGGARLRTLTAAGAAAGALGLMSVLSSCNIVAPVAMIIEGPPSVDPQFKLDKDRPTLILVDDTLNILPRRRLRNEMSKKAQDMLLAKGTLKKVIDAEAAYAVVAGDREGKATSLIEIARAVGAEVIVSVTVDSFGVTSPDNEMVYECGFRVRVLDVGRAPQPRVWPPAEIAEGAACTARLRLPAGRKIDTNAEWSAAQNSLAEQTGKAIAQVFQKHERSQSAAAGK